MSAQSDRFRVLRRLTEIRFEDELRGYSKNQVDRVLETLVPLADDVEQLQAKLAEAERRVATAEAGLVEAREQASRSEATTPIEAPVVVAAAEVATPSQDFDETLRNTLMLAQRTADTVVREASEEAEELRSSARAEALALSTKSEASASEAVAEGEAAKAKMLSEVEAERVSLLETSRAKASTQIAAIEAELSTVHESQRSELISQIEDLQKIRDLLADDIDNFEAYLAERRETVRSAMSEINVVLDDPAKIRPSIPPAASKVAEINPDAYKPIKVELESLQEAENPLPAQGSQVASVVKKTERIEVQVEEIEPVVEDAEDTTNSLSAGIDDLLSTGPATEAMPLVPDAAAIPVSDPWGNDESNLAASPTPEVKIEDSKDADTGQADEHRSGVDESSAKSASQEVTSRHKTTAKTQDPTDSGIPERLTSSSADGDSSEAIQLDSKAPERPAWADSVPRDSASTNDGDKTDPFLDELRKATSQGEEDDDALSSFLDDDKDTSRGGWFGRRR